MSDVIFAADLDTFFLMQGALLIFFMQSGFAMVEVGSINVLNLRLATETILVKNLMDVSLGAICWWLVGYGFAYGRSSGFIGGSEFLLRSEELR